MKDSSRLMKRSSKENDEVRRAKRKAKKRRRDESVSTSSSDSEDSRTRRKQRLKDSKRKRARSSSSGDHSSLLRKRRKSSRKSEGEFRKKSSKVKLKKKKRSTRSRRDPTESSSTSYSSSENCSTCRDHCGSEEDNHMGKSKRQDNGREDRSKRADTGKIHLANDTERSLDRNNPARSSSCSDCKEELRADSGRLMKKRSRSSRGADEGIVMSRSYDDDDPLKGDTCYLGEQGKQEAWSFGTEYDREKQTIEESERWEMGSDKNICFLDSRDIVTINHEKSHDNGKEKNASDDVHDAQGAQNGNGYSKQEEYASRDADLEDDTSSKLGTGSPEDKDLGAKSGNRYSKQEEYASRVADLEDDTSSKLGSPEDKDMEVILRQKALENFKRFCCKRLENSQSQVDEQICGGGCTKEAPKSDDQGFERLSCDKGGRTTERNSVVILDRVNPNRAPEVQEHSRSGGNVALSSARNIITSSGNIPGNFEGRNNNDKDDGMSKTRKASNKGSASGIKDAKEVDITIGTSAAMSGEIFSKGLERSRAASISCGVHATGATRADTPASVASESTDSVKANLNQNSSGPVATDSSQFEKKTMSVMRGGEMVQVSYKVYIPKKAPALARRQLQR